MTVTLELSEEASEWLRSAPDQSQVVDEMIRGRIRYEDELAKKYGPKATEVVERAVREGRQMKASGRSREEAADELIATVEGVEKRLNG